MSAPTTITGGGSAVGCVLRRNSVGRQRRSPQVHTHFNTCTPPTSNLPRLGPRLRDLHEDARPRTRRQAEGFPEKSTTRALSARLWLDVTELVFDAHMTVVSSSVEYTKRVLERRCTMTKAHNQIRCLAGVIVNSGFMVGSASYACEHTGSCRIARKL